MTFSRTMLFLRRPAPIASPTDAASRSAMKRRRPLWFGLNLPCVRALGLAQFPPQDPCHLGAHDRRRRSRPWRPDLLDLRDCLEIHGEGEVAEAITSLRYMSDARPSEVVRQYGDAAGGQHVEHPNAALRRLY